MSEFKCDVCNKVFDRKNDYKRHLDKKQVCVSIEQLQSTDISNLKKNNFKNIINKCFDILRSDTTMIVGDKALRNITYLLVLKCIESKFDNEIDIDNEEYYDFSDIEGDDVKRRLLKCVRFSNLIKENEQNMIIILEHIWPYILSQHPKTSHIYLKNKSFDFSSAITFQKLVTEINKVEIDGDILGDAYENLIGETMKGRILGQFFTPHVAKELMIDLIKPQVFDNGTVETCCDPTMGTAGFLITYLHKVQSIAKERSIQLDWNFLTTNGLYGKEIEPDTYQLACSNMLISTGHVFNNLDRGDSIRQPITKKFDVVMANPPYGIKGLKYDNFINDAIRHHMPIKTDSAVPLFIQTIISMLNINGRCTIVLPDGQDLFSKTNQALVQVREYLMKTCDLKEIIYLPSGMFTNTSIKTCIFYFIKKHDGSEVLSQNTKRKKTIYSFSEEHATTTIKYYQYDEKEKCKKFIIEVNIDAVANNSYSLNYSDYMEKEVVEYNTDIEWKRLGDIFELKKSGKTNSKDITNSGEYPFYKASCNNPSGTHNSYDFDNVEYLLIIKSGGSSANPVSDNYGIGKVFLVNGKCAANVAVFQLLPKNKMNIRYYYHYLILIQNKIQLLAKYCTNNGNIDMNELMNLQIPIPSIQLQNDIVEYLDFLHELNAEHEEKIKKYKKANEFYIKNNTSGDDVETKVLGDVCEVKQGNILTKEQMQDGNIMVIGGGKIIGNHNINNRQKNEIVITRVGDLHINFMLSEYYLTDNGFSITSNNYNIKYIYYIMNYMYNEILKLYNGTAQKVISKTNLQTLQIPIPPLNKQRQIVSYCDNNNRKIEQLKLEIKQNKKLIKSYLDNIIYKKQDTTPVVTSDMSHTEKIKAICNIMKSDRNVKFLDFADLF